MDPRHSDSSFPLFSVRLDEDGIVFVLHSDGSREWDLVSILGHSVLSVVMI